ncbi:hypothetical protein [Microbacterium aurantiacum]|uniref:hypothetical protein n=1 Tax=Microbacterium aurantiacum TaxID=162393 RepID=UPI000C7FAC2E|nr:hypothetical protein [Microbacterium aurantiacum]
MTLVRTASTPLAALGVLALAAGLVVGCSPAPKPTPTAAFASEEEAFAAAEETYRAYLQASAARADGDEAADPEAYLSGAALESDIQTQRELTAAGLKIVGASTVHDFLGLVARFDTKIAEVTAEVCVDISASRVIDDSGSDVTPTTRPERGKVEVVFSGDNDQLLISNTAPAESSAC